MYFPLISIGLWYKNALHYVIHIMRCDANDKLVTDNWYCRETDITSQPEKGE
jgi:hypothetical protein